MSIPIQIRTTKNCVFFVGSLPSSSNCKAPKTSWFLEISPVACSFAVASLQTLQISPFAGPTITQRPQHSTIHHPPSLWTSTAIAIKLAGSSVTLERPKLQSGCLLFFFRFPNLKKKPLNPFLAWFWELLKNKTLMICPTARAARFRHSTGTVTRIESLQPCSTQKPATRNWLRSHSMLSFLAGQVVFDAFIKWTWKYKNEIPSWSWNTALGRSFASDWAPQDSNSETLHDENC